MSLTETCPNQRWKKVVNVIHDADRMLTGKQEKELVFKHFGVSLVRGQFKTSDIESAIKSKFPSKKVPKTKIATVLFLTKKKGLIREVSPRDGKNAATYLTA